MRILANENIPGPVVRELRERGHDVVRAREALRGEAEQQRRPLRPSRRRPRR
jgi:hypothetical protein